MTRACGVPPCSSVKSAIIRPSSVVEPWIAVPRKSRIDFLACSYAAAGMSAYEVATIHCARLSVVPIALTPFLALPPRLSPLGLVHTNSFSPRLSRRVSRGWTGRPRHAGPGLVLLGAQAPLEVGVPVGQA